MALTTFEGSRSGRRFYASPLARRIAMQSGADLATIRGSGPRGRIVEKDVRAALTGAACPSAATVADTARTPAFIPGRDSSAGKIKALFQPGSFEEIPIDGMRRTIARRLVESKQTIPHFYLSLDCELDPLIELRELLNKRAKAKDGIPEYRISINHFVIKALALALQRVPAANTVWADDVLLRMKHSNISVAVAVEGGLMTPVVRKVEAKTLSTISAEMKDLATRARERRLRAAELSGGSAAISNLGMYGVREFQAVINPPQSSILAVGAVERRVVAKGNQPTVVQAMTVTLSCDHRVVDGATGAELLSAFRELIQNPITMLV